MLELALRLELVLVQALELPQVLVPVQYAVVALLAPKGALGLARRHIFQVHENHQWCLSSC
ncbi:hypothetical protein QP933_01850 [Corynebacterium pseudodiphtheriticum]|uniref:hypothetical protein n=1 Tax=Corynebacterium pseudodiphtheriticum TaxID=37637 RepID=UPI002551C0EB|nr:hypothetical protein [Corynebacterium pseudodiphtheriticum]MDK8499687.1 hypothetical protein [Corynebacterium pseudodiphtheriticum]MDK8583279.1 hypothetical protein [Corynebacterium pseudodiphtheriticum]MDK8838912.1 hypothetical protein [Corynebacterium pseudodiphtheriticum]